MLGYDYLQTDLYRWRSIHWKYDAISLREIGWDSGLI